mmetsp:Transcript_18364/g.49375  ORF Transcript_18364/g.49375 Transcript_18364/m.49375 type:complete len:205 (-) Transcript_18364:1210-1824(-)
MITGGHTETPDGRKAHGLGDLEGDEGTAGDRKVLTLGSIFPEGSTRGLLLPKANLHGAKAKCGADLAALSGDGSRVRPWTPGAGLVGDGTGSWCKLELCSPSRRRDLTPSITGPANGMLGTERAGVMTLSRSVNCDASACAVVATEGATVLQGVLARVRGRTDDCVRGGSPVGRLYTALGANVHAGADGCPVSFTEQAAEIGAA